MLRIAIIEDEDEQRAALCQALRNLAVAENWELNIRAFPDARSFFFARESEAFDLLLLDLILPGLSGLEIAERLRAEGDRVQLAFLSSERSAVFSGYKVGALDYLLKPWQEAELSQLLQRARAVYEYSSETFQRALLAAQYREVKDIYLRMRGWRQGSWRRSAAI